MEAVLLDKEKPLGVMTNRELAELAKLHPNDHDILREIYEVLRPRKRKSADIARQWIVRQLNGEPHPQPPTTRNPWIKRGIGFVVLCAGTIAVGVAHGVGEDIWQIMKPWLEAAFPQ